jgi:predicted metal-dependent hydrolase
MRRLTIKTPTGPLEYTITHRSRVKKRLHMELDDNGGLVVVAPERWSRAHIKATLVQNTSRVEQFLARAQERHLPPLQYQEGEEHLFLGESYLMVISHVKAGENKVAVCNGELQFATSVLQRENIQTGLQNWYQQQAKTVFSQRLQVIARRAPWAKDRDIPLSLRRMKRTWGNCSSKGVIKLNTHLIKAPPGIIDSVIAHELCHLVEMNHGSAFYTLLENLNPNWRKDRAVLRSEGFVYLRT